VKRGEEKNKGYINIKGHKRKEAKDKVKTEMKGGTEKRMGILRLSFLGSELEDEYKVV
jgi:hypothetical protein